MTIKFDRPLGTPADLKELEYISALQQTSPKLRQDASIDAKDIVNLLSSRHGLLVDVDVVKQSILVELVGEFDTESPLYKMDLVQVVALLLIPHLLKNGDEGKAMERVLAVLVSEVDSPKLDRGFLKQVLDFHGEANVSDDTLDAMIQVAGGEGCELTASSLLGALTSDVQLYQAEWTDRLSTHYQDVFSSFHHGKRVDKKSTTHSMSLDEEDPIISSSHPSLHEENIIDEIKIQVNKHRKSSIKPTPKLRKIYTAPAIDQVADTYASQSFTVLLWASMILVYLAYFWNFDLDWGQFSCGRFSEFSCKVLSGIVSWLVIFLELSVFGTAYIFLGSAGNSLYDNRVIFVGRMLIGMAIILFSTLLSLFYVVTTPVFSTVKNGRFLAAYIGAAVLGIILLIIQIIGLIGEFYSTEFLEKHAWLEAILTPSMQKMERRTKIAARTKMSLMVDNALVYHKDSDQSIGLSQGFKMTARGTALLNYQTRDDKMERCGGIVWGWKKVFNGSIFTEEGVWLHSRLVSSTLTQLFLCIFLVVFFAIFLLELLNYFSNTSDPGQAPEESSSEEPVVYVWEAGVAGAAGLIAGVGACFAIAIVYIPSFISSCIKYRTGVFPSLRDRSFPMYRVAIDLVTTLYGSAFWGCIFTGIFATVLVGGVVFFAVWHKTRSVVMTIIAQLVGIAVTLCLKQIVLLFLRKQFRAAFYRMMPLKDNFMNVMLEAWNIGLSSGIMFMRAAKLLLITVFYLGRLDTPLLADGVGLVGPIQLDSYPYSFRKDLLQHDAHRHPYIERLTTLYMMKLRYGKDFGNRANSCWRVLFALCLMPWMRKYRLRELQSLEGLDEEIEEAEAELANASGDEPEGQAGTPDRVLQRAATTRRLESMKNLRSLHNIGTEANREELLEREVIILRERNRQLLAQVKQLGGNPASSRRNLMAFHDQGTAATGVYPDRRQTAENSSQLSLVREECEEECSAQEVSGDGETTLEDKTIEEVVSSEPDGGANKKQDECIVS